MNLDHYVVDIEIVAAVAQKERCQASVGQGL